MTHIEPKIWSALPINRWELNLWQHDDLGWKLVSRHAHAGGLFTDCPTVSYSYLSAAELLDVLDAVLRTNEHR